MKWAVKPSSVLDATVNTDFAQADVDRQVVNLSRFSVFFPEKRQFFLENASLFAIGDSSTTGEGGEGYGTHVSGVYQSNRGYAQFSSAIITDDYRAEAGFVPRANTIRTNFGGYPNLRPKWKPKWVRALEPDLFVTTYHRASDRRLQEATVSFKPLYLTLANGGSIRGYFLYEKQRLDESFAPLPGLSVGRGKYDFLRYGLRLISDPSRRLRGSVTVETGGFYDGRRQLVTGDITYAPSPRAAFGVSWERNALHDVGEGRLDRTTQLIAPEVRLALNPRLQLYAFYQHNTAAESNSLFARLAWEYRPLSFVHLVLNDRAAIDDGGFLPPFPRDRQVILKFSFMRQM